MKYFKMQNSGFGILKCNKKDVNNQDQNSWNKRKTSSAIGFLYIYGQVHIGAVVSADLQQGGS